MYWAGRNKPAKTNIAADKKPPKKFVFFGARDARFSNFLEWRKVKTTGRPAGRPFIPWEWNRFALHHFRQKQGQKSQK